MFSSFFNFLAQSDVVEPVFVIVGGGFFPFPLERLYYRMAGLNEPEKGCEQSVSISLNLAISVSAL